MTVFITHSLGGGSNLRKGAKHYLVDVACSKFTLNTFSSLFTSRRKSCFTTELKAGCTTFLSMAYILAVNPRIMADSGGPCVVPEGESTDSQEYQQCLFEIQQQYLTATALASMIACFLMGLLVNLPIALSVG